MKRSIGSTRNHRTGERFSTCGDYLQGVARIRCTNPNCGHDYFRPFSCKGFYLCPSCSRKRTILFAEHLTNEVLLRLPHRQFVFTLPKMLRPFFRHDRRLFTDSALALPYLPTSFSCHAFADSQFRRNRHAASPNAHLRCALPIVLFLPLTRVPADRWAHFTNRV